MLGFAAALAEAAIPGVIETHLEVRDHLRVEHLEESDGPAIGDALRDFDEAERLLAFRERLDRAEVGVARRKAGVQARCATSLKPD